MNITSASRKNGDGEASDHAYGCDFADDDVRRLHNSAWNEHRSRPERAIIIAASAYALITGISNGRDTDRAAADATEVAKGQRTLIRDFLAENYAIQAACSARAEEQGITLSAAPAELLVKDAEANLTDTASPLIRARVCYARASVLQNQFDYARAESALRTGLSLLPGEESPIEAANLPEFRLRIDTLNNLGRLQIFQGDFRKALETELNVLAMAKQAPTGSGDYPYGEASALKNLAIVYQRLGNFVEATAAVHRSLEMNEAQGDYFSKISCLMDLTHISLCINEPASALDYLNTALEISSTHHYVVTEAIVLGNMGYVFYVRGDLDRAIEHYETAVKIQRKINHLRGESVTLCNLGDALEAKGRLMEAQDKLEEALAIHRKLGDRHGIATTLISLGRLSAQTDTHEVNAATEDVPLFRVYLEEALEVIALTGSQDLLVAAHEAFSQAYKCVGDYPKALHHYVLFHEYKEKMSAMHAADRTQALLVKHELEQSRKDSEVQRQHAAELRTALEEAREQRALAERLANQDMLTGLPNRRQGDRLLASALETSQKEERALTVIFADADHFKSINDRYSHLTGDRVLRQLAALCQQHCRTTDIAARYGGEEILFVLPDTDQSEAVWWADQLRIQVAQFDWTVIHPELSVTLSLGVASWAPRDEPSLLVSLLSRADARLYEAKKAGRNCVRP